MREMNPPQEHPQGEENSWPNEVKCKMEIERWREALENAGLSEKYKDVIDGFQHAFDQGIPLHLVQYLRWFTPPNHNTANLAREGIEENFRKEVAAGRIYGPFSHEEVARRFPFFRSSPLGTAINGDVSVRPINDLSYPYGEGAIPSVNSFVDKKDLTTTWDNFKTVARFFRQNTQQYQLGLFDWEKAYQQIPTKMNQWPFLMVQNFEGDLYLDTRITFGGVAGSGSFGRPANAWKELMIQEFTVTHVFQWVDNNLFVKEPNSRVKMDEIVARLASLGVKTNDKKYSEFGNKQKFIGFVWDGIERTVGLPPGKKEERLQQIRKFLVPGAQFTYKEALTLAGRLNHVTYLLPQLRCYLRSIYQWQKEWQHHSAKQPVSIEMREDLKWWTTALENYDSTKLIPYPDPTDVGWVGDVLTSYGIGVIVGQRWARFRLKHNPPRAQHREHTSMAGNGGGTARPHTTTHHGSSPRENFHCKNRQ
jgi:hypothetical protein